MAVRVVLTLILLYMYIGEVGGGGALNKAA